MAAPPLLPGLHNLPREGTESWEHSGASELIGFLLHREGKWALLSEAHSG